MLGRFEYFTGTDWSPREADSAAIPLGGLGQVYSVTRFAGRYMLVTLNTTQTSSDEIVAFFSCSPTGPFAHRARLYRTPESGADGTYHNADIYTYNVFAHPELSDDTRLVLSYSVGSTNLEDTYRDVTTGRPRFVDVTFQSP